MFTEEQYEKELKRLQRNQRQTKPVVIFFIILIVAEFVLGGVLTATAYNYGMAIIALAISTCVLLGIVIILYFIEKKQLQRMQDRERFIFDENERLKKELDEKYREYKKSENHKPYDIDELIMYDMIDEDFDEDN